jgi:hypothetical protein
VASDTLVVYLTGHGDATALAGLSPAPIQAALRAFGADVHVIVILDSSYSGAFLPALSTSADRVITATDANGPALFDEDPADDPNAATDGGSEFTSGFVEDWESILNDAQALSDAQQRALNENRPLWDVLAELSFHSAVDKDAGAASQRTAPQMVPAQQPTPTPTLTPTATSTPLPPSATPTPPPTATFTPLPPAPVLDFVVDNPVVPAGKCAVLRWTAVNAASLFLDNQPVPATGRQQVCPTVTTTYTLVANWAGGQVSKQVTVSVATPAAPPPTFGSLDTPTNTWYDAAGCGRTDLPVFAQVDNASSVTIFYRIQPAQLPATAWSSLPMSLGSGSVWTRTLTIADMPQANGVMEFYFAASGPGGAAQSPVYNFVTYNHCTPIG